MGCKPKLDWVPLLGRTAGLGPDLVAQTPRRVSGLVPSPSCILPKVHPLCCGRHDKGTHRFGRRQTHCTDEGQPFSPIVPRPGSFRHSHGALFVRVRLRNSRHPPTDVQKLLAQVPPIPVRYGTSITGAFAGSHLFCRAVNARRIGFRRFRMRRLRVIVVRFGAKPRALPAARVVNETGNRRRRYTFSDENAACQCPEFMVRIRLPPATGPLIAIGQQGVVLGSSRGLRSQPLTEFLPHDQTARLVPPRQKEYCHEGYESLDG